MRDAAISQLSIMFDTCKGEDWPRVRRLVSWLADDEQPLADWFVVATDPSRVRYFDDDSEAMDETNWDALPIDRSELFDTSDPESVNPLDEIVAAGVGFYRDTFETYLIVAPGNEEVLDAMLDTRKSLSDYPLLDEDAYSEREYNAWLDFMSDGLRYDTLRDLSGPIDEDTVEAISDAWDDIAPAAAQHLHYYNGFSGEHGPDFSECIARTLVDGLARVIA